MKKGGYAKANAGFTIVETLIVLAVTGALFTVAIAYTSGRQDNAMFATAVVDLKQQLTQIANETQSGYFPSSSGFTCTPTNYSDVTHQYDPPTFAAGGDTQGKHSGCVFAGKSLLFGNDTPGQMTVYSLAGNRLNRSGQPVSNAVEAEPVAVAPGEVTNTDAPNLAVTEKFSNGLKLTWTRVMPSVVHNPPGQPFVITFMSNFSDGTHTDGSNVMLNSGSTAGQFGLYGMGNPAPGGWPTTGLDPIEKVADNIWYVAKNGATGPSPASGFYQLSQGVELCFASGTTNQSVAIAISGDGSFNVSSKVFGGQTC